jgi:hypothetical protein
MEERMRVLAWSVSVVVLAWTVSAHAAPSLRGTYAFTGTAVCLVAPGNVPAAVPLPNPTPGFALPNSGFKPNLQPNDTGPNMPPTASYTRSFSVEGTRTFNGDGTGTVMGTGVGVVGPPTPGPTGFPHFPPSASVANFTFNFTYQVNGDGTWTSTMTPGTYLETIVAGPRSIPTHQTATVDAIPPLSGWISNDGKTLIAAHQDAIVETHTYSNGDVDPQICHRSRVFISIGP